MFQSPPVIRPSLYLLILFAAGVGVGNLFTRQGSFTSAEWGTLALCSLLAISSAGRILRALTPARNTQD